MKLVYKMILTMGIVAIVPLAIAGWQIISIYQQSQETAKSEQRVQMIEDITRIIEEDYVAGWQNYLGMLSSMQQVNVMSDPERQALISGLVTQFEDLEMIIIFNEYFEAVSGALEEQLENEVKTHEDLLDNLNYQNEAALLQAEQGETYLGDAYYIPRLDTYYLTFAFPLPIREDLNYFLVAKISLKKLQQDFVEIAASKLRGHARFHLIDNQGQILASARALQDDADNNRGELSADLSQHPIVSDWLNAPAAQTHFQTRQYINADNVAMLSAWKGLTRINWLVLVEQPEAEAFLEIKHMRRSLLRWLLIAMLISIFGAFVMSRWISKPITIFAQRAGEVAGLNFESRIKAEITSSNLTEMLNRIARRTDEVGILARAFLQMETDLGNSIENLKITTAANERMQSELNIGHEIQMSMLPLEFPAFPDRNEFDIFAQLIPAREVGGDFYDFFLVDDENLCLCVGDVSGKGVPAALFMALSKTQIKARSKSSRSPAALITEVNDEISRDNPASMFITLFFAIVNVKTGEMVFCNAGHNPPYLKRSACELTALKHRHGPVIGAVGGITYKEDRLLINPGDSILLYTDGVTEAMNPHNQLFCESRLEDLLLAQKFDSPAEMTQAVVATVKAFEGEANQADDITVLAFELKKPA